MPPITLSPISNATVKVRWKEPYASEGLNRKMAVVVPAGVYRGLKLGVSASNLSVDLLADSAGDHVAVQESSTGFQTTYVDDSSGTITLPLTGFTTNDVVVICLVVGYAVGATTTAEFRGYELSEFEALTDAVKSALVVLGTVLRPAAGIIPAVNITHDRRTLPFLRRTDESTPWNPLIRNGGFELGATNATNAGASPFWTTYATSANFTIRPVVTEAHSGAKSLEMTTSAAGVVTATIWQDLFVPVTPGRFIMGRLYKKAIQAATLSSGRIRFTFGDQDGLNDVNEDLLFDVSAIDGSFEEFSGIVKIPAAARVLKGVFVVIAGTYAGAGPCIRIDDAQAWMQVDAANWLDVLDARAGEGAFGRVIIGTVNSFSTSGAKLSNPGNLVEFERGDGSLLASPPAISIPARVTGSIEYTLLFQSIPPGGQGYRKYMSSTGRMVDAVNASYDNTANLWTKDVNGVSAYKQEARDTGFSSFSRIADAAWADASWIQHFETASPETTTLLNPKFAPRLMTRDQVGNRRVALDHLGLRAGRVTVLHQNWSAPMATAWSSLATGTGTNTIINSDSSIPGPVQRQFVNANGDRAGSYAASVWYTATTNAIRVVEFELSCADLAGVPVLQYQAGFMHDEGGDPSPDNYVKISKTSASANWFFNTQGFGTGAGSNDTGIPAGGLQRFRVEIYESATPGGARALCYINGALVAERVANLPDASQSMSLSFAFKATGVIANKQVILSPVTFTTTRYLSDDAL